MILDRLKSNRVNKLTSAFSMVRLSDIASVEKLMKATQELDLNKSPGFDGMTVRDLLGNLKETDLAQLTIEAIIQGKFKPGSLLERLIPKHNSDKTRSIFIPCVLDKAIQRMMVAGLTPTTEARFHDWSYGFRPARNIQQAVTQASVFVKDGFAVCLLIDLENFFGLINRERLRKYLRDYNIDQSTRQLINQFIKAPIIGPNRRSAGIGIPAGLPLAPLLANIYLHPLDCDLDRLGIPFVRFADDITLFFKSESECRQYQKEFLLAWEPKYAVRINYLKTHLVTVGNRSLLGFQVDDSGRITVSATVVDAFCTSLVDLLSSRSFLFTKDGKPSREIIRSKVSSALKCYSIAENFHELDAAINRALGQIREGVQRNHLSMEIATASQKEIWRIDDYYELLQDVLYDVFPATNELKIFEKVINEINIKKTKEFL